jgi:tripartite-type tricarboxylate transporter receptor subunit TctC
LRPRHGWPCPAAAQDYPSKPITLVVPFGPGSGTDQMARLYAKALGDEAKVPIVVENKGGASGFIAAQFVAKAAPDGYTLMMTTNTTHAANEHLFKKLPYDPVKDFAPIGLLSTGQMLLLVPPDSPYKSVADLLAAAKKRPASWTSAAAPRPARWPASCCSRWRTWTWSTCPTRAIRRPSPT